MSWNLYLGGDLAPVLNALLTGDPQQIVQASTELWQSVLATNFELRAEAIADQIEFAQPELIGLQEAVVWRTGPLNPNESAMDVQFDFTEILLDELNERGMHYDVVAKTQGIDAELTGFTTLPNPSNPYGVLEDIRLTDRDVILARTDLPKSQLKLSNVQEENFDVALSVPGVFSVPRGWNSVDVKIRGKEFRLINTHLEIADFPQVQMAQAWELLSTAAATDMAVVILGDFNSSAVPGQPNDTPTYELLLGAGFRDTWEMTQVTEAFTCCQASDLRNESSIMDSRIDLVLVRGPLDVIDTDVVGEEQVDRTMQFADAPSGLWPSDHAGLLATLVLPSRQRGNQPFLFIESGASVVSTGNERGDEEVLVDGIEVKRPRAISLNAVDDLWQQAGRRRDVKLLGVEVPPLGLSFHEDEEADLLEWLGQRVSRPMSLTQF
ncbi:endonuclease/exonuclease/phosphatase family protein [Stieleria sp. ICT_E10.1]|uniref:endonuclease/exonuclease/phosphatase family protein n=1 Tax=Stieleria sedimenti TaxID=2976331 RepID=UPI00217FCF43|nr:endonuclease/exonuclease/phosphatase family protein [Stieleria sedimenti]MCS7467239.1 endonuclease/exonuclease/phosphatase family protein [Stieleria sedimenti]